MIRSVGRWFCVLAPLTLSSAEVASATTVYKCVDPAGRVLFSETPCNGGERITVNAPRPSIEDEADSEELRRVRAYNEAVGRRLETERQMRERSQSFKAMRALGPLPSNAVSEYLQTTSTGFIINLQTRNARYGITLKPRSRLPIGAILDVCFANPAAPDKPLKLKKQWDGSPTSIVLISPEFPKLVCGNHLITISIYDPAGQQRLLGTHNQLVQSRINLKKVRTVEDLGRAVERGNCP